MKPFASAPILLSLAVATPAVAQPSPPTSSRSTAAPPGGSSEATLAAGPTSPLAPPRRRPAVASVVEALASSLPAVSGAVVVASVPLESDASAPRGDALAELLVSRFAGARGHGVVSGVHPLERALTEARGAQHLWLLYPSIARGSLRVTARLYAVPSTRWARLRQALPGSLAHGFAEHAIDAEVRAYLEPIPLAPHAVHRARAAETGVLALACADFDRDGALEVLSVSRQRVALSRVVGGRVEPLSSRAWSELSPVHPSPHREPIAEALALALRAEDPLAEPELVVSLTDRARALRLDAHLEVLQSFASFAIAARGSYACARFPAITITGPLEPCEAGAPSPPRASVGGRYDALASALLVDRKGLAYEVWAGREDGALELFDEGGKQARLRSVGAQLAVGDLDQDGRPEILSSLDVERAADDAVVVSTWERDGRPPRELWRLPVPGGVSAIAVCPPDGPGRAPFLVGTSTELLVVR